LQAQQVGSNLQHPSLVPSNATMSQRSSRAMRSSAWAKSQQRPDARRVATNSDRDNSSRKHGCSASRLLQVAWWCYLQLHQHALLRLPTQGRHRSPRYSRRPSSSTQCLIQPARVSAATPAARTCKCGHSERGNARAAALHQHRPARRPAAPPPRATTARRHSS
jgi:hypothetical protein